MAQIVVYCISREEEKAVRTELAPILEEWEEKTFYREFTADRSGFLRYIGGSPYLVIFIIQSAPDGKETVHLAKQANPKAGIVWFSEENNALDALAFHITHFAQLPVSREKLSLAFRACLLSRAGPYVDIMQV